MKSRIRIASMLILVSLALMPGLALADGGKSVKVQPLAPKPGDVITVKGDLLGQKSEVEVRIIGSGVDIDLGEVQTDDEGDFTAQFRLPADLKPGIYRLTATGAESAQTELTVQGGLSSEQNSMQPAPVLRERPLTESIGLVALFGVLAGVGLFLARSARPEAA